MPDLPAQILQNSFFVVLGLFTVIAAFRALRRRQPEASSESEETQGSATFPADTSQDLSSPYAIGHAVPPPLPASAGVSTVHYRRLDFLWMGFLFLTFFGLTLSQLRSEAVDLSRVPVSGLVASIGFWVILAGVTMVVMIGRVGPVKWLGLRWKKWPHALWLGPSAMVGLWGVLLVMQLSGYMKWMESLGAEAVQDAVKFFQTSQDSAALAVMAIGAVIAAPLCEELVFRGYLYPSAKRFAGPWAAAFCSALLFAAAHASLTMLLPLFLLGLVFVFLYERTGSLWAPIAAHFCVNGATVAFQLAARYFNWPLDL